jgi:hypothetical protein
MGKLRPKDEAAGEEVPSVTTTWGSSRKSYWVTFLALRDGEAVVMTRQSSVHPANVR